MSYPIHDTAVYEADVDPADPNHANSLCVTMVGFNKRVLELGCTAGHVTRAMVRRGCTVVGVEIDPDAAKRAAEVAEEVVVADLDDPMALADLAGEQFDVVTAGDVLEHLRDPLPVLQVCRRLLKPGGFLVISLPNVAHADVRLALLDGEFTYREQGLLDTTHLRFFTRRTVDTLLWAAGLLPVEIRRVRVPIFATELQLDPTAYPSWLIDRIRRDPEAETFQFVVKAVIDDGAAAVRRLSERLNEMDEDLQRTTAEVFRLQAERHGLLSRVDESEAASAAAVMAAEASADRATEAERTIAAYQGLRTIRYSAPLRRFYRLLRGPSG